MESDRSLGILWRWRSMALGKKKPAKKADYRGANKNGEAKEME